MQYNVISLLDDLLKRSATPVVPTDTSKDHRAIGPEHLPIDWRCEWEEKSAIMQYDGGLTRERAEALALDLILVEMKQAGVCVLRAAG